MSAKRTVRVAEATPLRFGLAVGLGLMLVVVAGLLVWQVRAVLMVIFMGGFFAVGLDRPVQWLVRKGLSRPMAVLVLATAAFLLACGLTARFVPLVARQAEALFAAVPSIVDSALDNGLTGDLAAHTGLAEQIASKVTPQQIGSLLAGLLGGAASLLGFLAMAVTAALIGVFVLASLDRLRTASCRLAPASRRDQVCATVNQILGKVGAYLVGSVSIAAIAGTTALLFMLITGIPYAAVLALVVAVFDLIPQIGATLGATVVVIVALSQSLTLALVAVGFFIVYQQIENWIIYPRVMRQAVHISNLAAIVVVMVGAALFGVAGVLVAVPGYAAIRLVWREFAQPRLDAS